MPQPKRRRSNLLLDPPSREGLTSLKIFLVFQREFAARGDKPNVTLIAARLTASEADEIVREIPGTYVQKVYATKLKTKANGETHGRYVPEPA